MKPTPQVFKDIADELMQTTMTASMRREADKKVLMQGFHGECTFYLPLKEAAVVLDEWISHFDASGECSAEDALTERFKKRQPNEVVVAVAIEEGMVVFNNAFEKPIWWS